MNKHQLNQWIKYHAKILKCMNLLGNKCVNCGIANIAVLEFHHINKKTKYKEVSILCRLSSDWFLIKQEVLKCQLLCCNCHKLRHFNINLYNKHKNKIYLLSTIDNWIDCKKWTSEEVVELTRLYNLNKSRLDIAKSLNRHKCVVGKKIQLLIQNNVVVKRTKRISPYRKVSQDIKDKILYLSESIGPTKTANLLKLSRSTVSRIIKEQKNGK